MFHRGLWSSDSERSGHSLRFEFGPGVRYDEYTDGDTETQPLGYASGTWAWQMTDNAKFTQGVSVFGAEDTTLNSECAERGHQRTLF
jgi:putative salt-induced outer membrane protein